MDSVAYYNAVDNFILWFSSPLGMTALLVVIGLIIFVSISRTIAK